MLFLMVLLVQPLQAAAPDVAKNVRVAVDGETLSLENAIRRASADERLATYRQMRAELGGTVDGQVELARWCRKQRLAEEERLHWRIVLMMQPQQPDAAKGLGLRPYQGQLLTKDQIEKAKLEQKSIKEAERKWGPKLKQIKLALEHGEAAERESALRELEAVRDPHAMALVEQMFAGANTDIALLIVEMYAREAEQQSTEALARLAVQAKDAAVREKAAGELRYRPMESYVPVLVGALVAPIELSLRTDVEAGGPTFERYKSRAYTGRIVPSLYGVIRLSGNYTNKDVLIWSFETKPFSGLRVSAYRPDRYQYEYVLSCDSPDPKAPYEFRGALEATGAVGNDGGAPESLRGSIAALEKKIREANATSAEMNLRVDAALREATEANASAGMPSRVEKAADVRPRLWWDWWQQRLNLNNYFANGTVVWTQFGRMPIEQILVGDRVLTKKLDTGELAFNLVIGIDMRPNRDVRVLELGSRTIVSTPDQPFFVTDEGWRAAEKLESGMTLDSLAGLQRIANIRTGTADATYSLLVAELPNYFVDRDGVLAHDATQ
ncbi:MAG: HINT domain-containing protein [Planctomycetes bacterium]|nr:HINT domain-containing protein [Planctomycetota bacterium]